MSKDTRKIYAVSITKTTGTDVYVKAKSEEEALAWVNEDVNWFDTETVETNVKVDFSVDEEWEIGGQKMYDAEKD